MTSLLALYKKELKYQLRTYRFLIVIAIFFVLGLATPLLLNYMSLLLPGEDIASLLPEFTSSDVVNEYFDTVGQIGLIAAILVTMGVVSRERELGTAALTLCKPVGSGTFIVAKLAALVFVFGIGLLVGGLGCYIYTVILFGNLNALYFFVATLIVGLYLFVCLAVTVMYSCFFKSQLAAGGLALISLICLGATAGLPIMKDYSPGALLSWSKTAALGIGSNTWGALIVSLVLAMLTVFIGWQVFKRKEL